MRKFGSFGVTDDECRLKVLLLTLFQTYTYYAHHYSFNYFLNKVPPVGLEPTNSEEEGFTVPCNCHYATSAFLHKRRDSNSHQEFWRPVCYHCTTLVNSTNIVPVPDSNRIIFTTGTGMIRNYDKSNQEPDVGFEPTYN